MPEPGFGNWKNYQEVNIVFIIIKESSKLKTLLLFDKSN